MRKRIFIADDSAAVCQGLSLLIDSEPNLMVCGTAKTGEHTLKGIAATIPDLVILDISLPDVNGLTLIPQIQRINANIPILIVTMHESAIYTEAALKAGAKGYITKKDAAKAIIPEIRRILG